MWISAFNVAITGVKTAHAIGLISKDRAQREEDKLHARLDAKQAARRKKLDERKQRAKREANGEQEPGFFRSLFK